MYISFIVFPSEGLTYHRVQSDRPIQSGHIVHYCHSFYVVGGTTNLYPTQNTYILFPIKRAEVDEDEDEYDLEYFLEDVDNLSPDLRDKFPARSLTPYPIETLRTEAQQESAWTGDQYADFPDYIPASERDC